MEFRRRSANNGTVAGEDRTNNGEPRHRHLQETPCHSRSSEPFLGKLQHASLAMPAGKCILTPLHKFVEANKDRRILYFANRPVILEALRDIRILLRESTSRPTHLRQLVPDLPSYIGFRDACKRGAGGVWINGNKNIQPEFGNRNLDPELRNVDSNTTVDTLQAFAEVVRRGRVGRGRQVGTQTVQLALRAIGAKFELDTQPKRATKTGTPKAWTALEQQIEGYRRADPVPQAKLAIPVTVPRWCAKEGPRSASPKAQAVGDLTNAAFCYLLRVGEYTHTDTRATRHAQ